MLVSRITEEYFEQATEIGSSMLPEGQMVTKTSFLIVLKPFAIPFSVVYRKYLLNKYMVTICGSHEYLHFKLNASNLKNEWIVILFVSDNGA